MMGVGRRKGRGAKIAQRPESEGRGIWQEPEPKYYAVTHSLAPAQGHILPPPLRGCPVLGLPYRTRPTAHSSPDHRGAHLVVIIHPCIQNIQPATHSPPLRACTAMISSFGRGPRATQHPQPHISRAAATTNPSFFFSSCARISFSAMAVQDLGCPPLRLWDSPRIPTRIRIGGLWRSCAAPQSASNQCFSQSQPDIAHCSSACSYDLRGCPSEMISAARRTRCFTVSMSSNWRYELHQSRDTTRQ